MHGPSLQAAFIFESPMQGKPPGPGAGLLHCLDLVFVPLLQVTLQPDQADQVPQLPSEKIILFTMSFNLTSMQLF